MKEKILALLENADFQTELEKLGSEEEILAAFKAHGVDVTAEELKALDSADEELDLDALDNVAGGLQMITTKDIAKIKKMLKKLGEKLFK